MYCGIVRKCHIPSVPREIRSTLRQNTWHADHPGPRHQTDDVGVFGSPLSNEYRLVAKHFGLSAFEIRALARKGIDVIFGGAEEKQRLRRIMDA